MTRMSDSQLKNVVDTARRDNDFISNISTAVHPKVHEKISQIPMVGSAISNAVRGIERQLSKPKMEIMGKNVEVMFQGYNEQRAREKSGKDRHVKARFLRELLGVKNDPNEYGITALSGSNGKKK